MQASARCRWCPQPLSELQRRLGQTCGAAACRHRAEQALVLARRQAAAEVLRDAAAARHGPAVRGAPIVWLRHFEPRIGPVSQAERDGHAAHLAALVAAPETYTRDPLLAFPEDLGPAPPLDGALCSHCRGRCCQAGVGRRGFVDVELLRRHQQRHGGTLAQAAAHYLARVPEQHVEGSCVYHGAAGCVLPRDERAPVCNGFACDSLRSARELTAPSQAGGVLVVNHVDEQVRGSAWLARPQGPALPLPAPETAPAPAPAPDAAA